MTKVRKHKVSGSGENTMTKPLDSRVLHLAHEELRQRLGPQGTFNPDQVIAEDAHRIAAFKQNYIMTAKDEGKGLLTADLFYDLHDESPAFQGLTYNPAKILSGGPAWDRRIKEKTEKTGENGYVSRDKSLIKHAINQGLCDLLVKMSPQRARLFSYGGGDLSAFINNEGQLITALKDMPDYNVTSMSTVDILARYAVENARIAASKQFGVKSHYIVGDFMDNGGFDAPKDEGGNPIIFIFGGPLLNAPAMNNGASPEENFKKYLHKITLQHGVGATVVMSVDTDQNVKRQLKNYEMTKSFEAFILSAHARGLQEGLIISPYDILKYWKGVSEYDKTIDAVNIQWECKKKHTQHTVEGDFTYEKGERRSIILSHKWEEAKHRQLFEEANWEIREIFNEKGNCNRLIVAQSIAPAPIAL